jgi:hypothetical protein
MFEWINGLLSFFNLTVIAGFSAWTVAITALIKAAPPEWTSTYPKTIAFVVTALTVGTVGFLTKADPLTTLAVTLGATAGSYGLYDVLADLWKKLKE